MKRKLATAWFLVECVIFSATMSALGIMLADALVWVVMSNVPQLDNGAAVIMPDQVVTIIILAGGVALLGSLAGGLHRPWKAQR
jgi:ABC-type antimicrobial peptide transport system permease subunit